MPVLLRMSVDVPMPDAYQSWCAVTGTPAGDLDKAKRQSGLGLALEDAFDVIAPDWLNLGKALSTDGSAVLAHAPACAANVTDMGLMMAWTRLIEDWATDQAQTVLVLCNDPWLFRHLKGRPGIDTGRVPGLLKTEFRLWLRGYAVRFKAALGLARTSLALRFQRRLATQGQAVLMVYGHPRSTPERIDGYFGDLMQRLPNLQRILHVDCPESRARELGQDGCTLSLHAFGCPGAALLLPFDKWRPASLHRTGPQGWLVRRSAALEGGTGQAALLAWQRLCQRKWLKRTRPFVVAWPWESHSWERDFVRRARSLGVRTVGYQHSVVGRQMLNYSPISLKNGEADLPDAIPCVGPIAMEKLATMGVPRARLEIGGALRFTEINIIAPDPKAPVFVAVPFDGEIAAQMVEACRRIAAEAKTRFLIKDHPMSPIHFEEAEGLNRTETALSKQGALAGVVFAATTVGQEAALAGLPVWRFVPADRIAMDILPEEMDLPVVTAETLKEALESPGKPCNLALELLFAPVADNLWRELLGTDD